MKVRVVKAFRARGELMPVGTILNIRDEDYPKLIGKVEPVEDIDMLQDEYLNLLRRFWEIDADPAATIEDARRLVTRLDELYQKLHHAGCNVPVRLPIERKTSGGQKRWASE